MRNQLLFSTVDNNIYANRWQVDIPGVINTCKKDLTNPDRGATMATSRKAWTNIYFRVRRPHDRRAQHF
jgi:hypothetical protein